MSLSKMQREHSHSELFALLPLLKEYDKHLRAELAELEKALKQETPKSSERETKKPSRYPKRNVPQKNYKEEEVSDDDDYIYCDECDKEWKGMCRIHRPLRFIPNMKLPKDGSVSQRARKSLPPFLSISLSGIKGAGLGIWTEIELPKGTVFGPYEGTIVRREKDVSSSGYSWQIKKLGKVSHYVDGEDMSRSNWMRFVNCATVESRQNLIAFQFKGSIFYRAYKTVPKHCELLVWYGDYFASNLSIDLTEDVDDPPVTSGSAGVHACEKCSLLFSSEEYLKKHQRHHRDESSSRRHKCPSCSYSTDRVADLGRHLLTHSGKRPHECEVCGKAFTEKINLNRHLRVHSGETPFECKICGKRFSRSSSLHTHERSVHLKEKPFKCPTCGSAFSESGPLKAHQRTHSGQKPFKCELCEARFAQKTDLNRHVVYNHSRDFPHKCTSCDKGFVTPSQLRKHQLKKHPPAEE